MIPQNITKEHVNRAIKHVKQHGVPHHRQYLWYNLLYEGERYPSKYVISVANLCANGQKLEPSEFNSIEANTFLRALGFSIWYRDTYEIRGTQNYWNDIFTDVSWREFREAGATVSGFRERRSTIQKVKPGDILLCYVKGAQKWVGALEVRGPTDDDRPIWSEDVYPVRLAVRPIILLDTKDGVPLKQLKGKAHFYKDETDRQTYQGFLRMSPQLFKNRDEGEVIFDLLMQQAKMMSPERRYWVEITEVKNNTRPDRQRGEYACGKALWSPQTRTDGAKIYKNMERVQRGDVIFHLTDREGFTRISIAKSGAIRDKTAADIPPNTPWSNRDAYFVVWLKDCKKIAPPLKRAEFFDEPDAADRLRKLSEKYSRKEYDKHRKLGPCLFYERDLDLKEGQYLTEAPLELVGVLNNIYKKKTDKDLPHIVDSSAREEAQTLTLQEQYSEDNFIEETCFDRDTINSWRRKLEYKRHVIIQGPPGTGKTYIAERLAKLLISETLGFCRVVQFHPSYSYEDFIQGIRPQIDPEGKMTYGVENGRFIDFCEEAEKRDAKTPCVLIIDEINRAKLPRVFGELMYLLEYRKRTIPLAYSGTPRIPEN
ncbi:MAG: AAA family ATPase, partial [Halobacteriota archaeon]